MSAEGGGRRRGFSRAIGTPNVVGTPMQQFAQRETARRPPKWANPSRIIHSYFAAGSDQYGMAGFSLEGSYWSSLTMIDDGVPLSALFGGAKTGVWLATITADPWSVDPNASNAYVWAQISDDDSMWPGSSNMSTKPDGVGGETDGWWLTASATQVVTLDSFPILEARMMQYDGTAPLAVGMRIYIQTWRLQ